MSPWTFSRLCREAEQARAAADQALIAEAAEIRRHNIPIWRRRGAAIPFESGRGLTHVVDARINRGHRYGYKKSLPTHTRAWKVLHALVATPKMVHELAAQFGIDQRAMSNTINDLRARDYIQIVGQRSGFGGIKDKRNLYLATRQGLEALDHGTKAAA